MSNASQIKFLIFDALNLIRRVYGAQPGDDSPEKVTSSISTCTSSLERALMECNPTHAVCVFEGEGKSWRHELYADYKAGRSPMPKDLQSNLKKFKTSFFDHGVSSVSFPNIEADDAIATLASKVANQEGNATILSTDKSFFQLLSSRIVVRDHFKSQDIDASYVKEKFGVDPGQLIDLLALTGDSTNNIKGVPTIGPKTAVKLLTRFGSLEKLLSESVEGKTGENLRKHKENALLAKNLIQLKTDISLGINLKTLRYIS
jgi:5'-3' exonuclease